MMPAWIRRKQSAGSLNAQIRYAERQLATRRQLVGNRAKSLLGNIYKQMTAPATLVLASGIGFIAGELSNCPPPRPAPSPGPAENSQAATGMHLRSALSVLLSAHTLYNALPIAWLMKRFQQSRAKPTAARRYNRATRDSTQT
jgi:hypothetical protein